MLLTGQSNPHTRDINQRSTVGILKLINREDARVAAAVGQQLESIARVVDAVVLRLEGGGRLFYVGTGYQRSPGPARRRRVPSHI